MNKKEKDIRHLGVMQKRFGKIIEELDKLKDDVEPERFACARALTASGRRRICLADEIYECADRVRMVTQTLQGFVESLQEGGAE